MSTPPMIDLDAAKREAAYPDGIPVRFGGEEFLLPGELPADLLDPLLSEELDLVGVISKVFDDRAAKREAEKAKAAAEAPELPPGVPEDLKAKAEAADEDDDESLGEIIVDVLLARPALPAQVLQAIKDVFAALFGPEQYPKFVEQRPSINDYLRLARGLTALYGVSLGEAFGSPASSASGGETSSQTSPTATPDSTRAASGSGRTKRGSSASGGSAT